MSLKHFALIASLLALASPAMAQEPATDEATELEPIIVIAPVSPLDRSLHLLRLLVEQSAPCLGCDAALATQRTRSERVLSYLLESEPPVPTRDELLQLDIKLKDSPDLEYLRP